MTQVLLILLALLLAALFAIVQLMRRGKILRSETERLAAKLEGVVKAVQIQNEYHRRRGRVDEYSKRIVEEIRGAEDEESVHRIAGQLVAGWNRMPDNRDEKANGN